MSERESMCVSERERERILSLEGMTNIDPNSTERERDRAKERETERETERERARERE